MDSIFNIKKRYDALMELADDKSIAQDELNTALIEVMDDVVSKGENGIIYLHSIQNAIDGAKSEKKKIDAYIKTLETRKKRIENAYAYAIGEMKIKSIMTSRGEMKVKKNPPAVIVDDLTKIPTRYMRQKIQVDIDKVAIKAAIKAGEEVPGAHLEQGTSLSY